MSRQVYAIHLAMTRVASCDAGVCQVCEAPSVYRFPTSTWSHQWQTLDEWRAPWNIAHVLDPLETVVCKWNAEEFVSAETARTSLLTRLSYEGAVFVISTLQPVAKTGSIRLASNLRSIRSNSHHVLHHSLLEICLAWHRHWR